MEKATSGDEECDPEPVLSPNEFDAILPAFPALAREVQKTVEADMYGVRSQLNEYWLKRRHLNSTITDGYREAQRFLDMIGLRKLQKLYPSPSLSSRDGWFNCTPRSAGGSM